MQIVKIIMGCIFFLMGFFTVASGLYIILRKEYQEALKTLAQQSPKLAGKSPIEDVVTPLAQSSVQLMETVNKLIQTAVGVGAFLCMLGSGLCILAYWMIAN
ncbi:MAG TPA: hypothetical protein VH186_24505 [Chloroflexia bacterium]|nr:hypothetical protein [Chloroflexia bacterium]